MATGRKGAEADAANRQYFWPHFKTPMAESKIAINRTGPGRHIILTLLFLAVAASVSVHCYRYSVFGIDLLGYAGSIALADTGDVVRAHDIVYGAPLTPHLRGLDENTEQSLDMRRRAADPYVAALYFPYFAIKPLYILTLQAIHKLGFSVIDAVRAASALFYFGIAAMLWAYTGSWLSVVVMILPEMMLLGQATDPDGMSCCVMLLGLWMVFLRQSDMGILALLLAIWVRPENSLLCLLVVFALLFEGRVDWKKAAVLVFLSVGSEAVINQFGYPWQELYRHLLGATPGNGGASVFSNFGRSLVSAVNDSLHSSAPLFALLWLVCFPLVKKDFRWIMGITLVFSAVRFVLFPIYEPRYYGLFFVTTSIAGVLLIQNGGYLSLGKKILNYLSDSASQKLRRAA